MHWSVIGAFWASVIASIVAVSATIINYLFIRSQIDPHVIVYVTPDERRPSIILLIIENIGKSMAKNISFAFDKPIPKNAFGFGDAPIPKPMDEGPLSNGLPALGPGAKRVITWGQYGGIYKSIGNEVVYVTIRFTSDRKIPFTSISHEVICPIDIKSFESTDASDNNWDMKTVEELKNITKAIVKLKQ